MGYAARQPVMTGDEYLVWEAGQTDRHELVDGEVYAMAGAEAGHVTTAGNLYMALRQHLRGTPCMTFISDMKLHVAARDSYFYPDVFVTCAEADRASRLVMREPDPKDRRAKIVSITDMGRTVISAAQQPQHKTIEAIFNVLTDDQKQHLKEIIRCLSEKTEELQGERDRNAGDPSAASSARSLQAVG